MVGEGTGPGASTAPALGPSTQPTLAVVHHAKDPDAPLVLFLPGISDFRGLERRLVRGVVASGMNANVEVYTWPAYNAGLGALMNYARNQQEAKHVTQIMRDARAAHPRQPIYVIAHSGGCGIAVWALEGLPAGERVEQVVLLAPALSPGYDLSAALGHVRGKMYAFTSREDPVLGVMTKTFGTIDRVSTEAAGLNGFVRPASADAKLYAEKLSPMPYQPEWAGLGHMGDHIGSLEPKFAQDVIAPLLVPAK
jgi:pimeloyl-ACP methyl ester carboxylesterase